MVTLDHFARSAVISIEDLCHQLQLQSEGNNPDNPHASIVIVDCRFSLMQPLLGRQQYETSHLPGAYYLDLNQDLSSPVATHGGRHPLPNPEVVAAQLTAMGITPETLVVAYDDSRLAFAARLWWLLRYLGHDRAAVLNGGWSAWQAAGLSTTAEIPPPRQGAFVPRPNPQAIVNIQDIRERQSQPELESKMILIDSRESVRYRGESEPIDPIAGHIPGAVNYPWQTVTDENGFVQSLDIQRDRWKALSAAPPSPEIIAYCGSGVTACVNLLSLYQVGIPAKLYPGSWSDWCSYLV
ncbi:sulfurtransferase [Alkalinema pantanalense CENA528]|uniref:sulfurtransferase n=1 Tax=Alkalinema pantanalense TaxID=1620705 RepID=UPI003D6EF514